MLTLYVTCDTVASKYLRLSTILAVPIILGQKIEGNVHVNLINRCSFNISFWSFCMSYH